jgi:hypothetical protein
MDTCPQGTLSNIKRMNGISYCTTRLNLIICIQRKVLDIKRADSLMEIISIYGNYKCRTLVSHTEFYSRLFYKKKIIHVFFF